MRDVDHKAVTQQCQKGIEYHMMFDFMAEPNNTCIFKRLAKFPFQNTRRVN